MRCMEIWSTLLHTKATSGFIPLSVGLKGSKQELSAYKGAKGSVPFPLNKPIPYELIRKIVEFRVAESIKQVETKKEKNKKK